MLGQAYTQGAQQALAEIEKTAGTEFAEKIANKMGFMERAKSVKDKVFGKAKAGYEATKHALGNPKETATKAKEGVKGYHKGMGENFSNAFRKSDNPSMTGAHGGKRDMHTKIPMSYRAKELGKGVAKAAPHAAAAGAVGYGAHKAMED